MREAPRRQEHEILGLGRLDVEGEHALRHERSRGEPQQLREIADIDDGVGREDEVEFPLFALEEGENILGRDPAAAIFIDHASVSRRHARVTVSADGATIEDLGSKNGTKVGGQVISGVAPLADADEIRLGSVPMTFRVFPLSGSTATANSRV